MLVEPVLADLDFTGGPSIVMLNGMGGSPLIELYLLYGEVATLLEKAGVQVARTLVGNYITSLDMAGASVTVLKADDELIACGMLPWRPQACDGESERGRSRRPSTVWSAGCPRSATPCTSTVPTSPSSTRRSVTRTTGPT